MARADGQEVDDREAIHRIGIGLAEGDLMVGFCLEGVEGRNGVALGSQGLIEGQPVVSSGLHGDTPGHSESRAGLATRHPAHWCYGSERERSAPGWWRQSPWHRDDAWRH